jgi:hypothetical protein
MQQRCAVLIDVVLIRLTMAFAPSAKFISALDLYTTPLKAIMAGYEQSCPGGVLLGGLGDTYFSKSTHSRS